MSRGLSAWLLSSLALLNACSGKTERGVGGDAPAEKPAAGPNNVSEPNDAPAPRFSNERRHVLMVVELELAARSAKVLRARPVDLPLPRKRGPSAQGPWQVDVLDAEGAVLYTAALADGASVRGEFPDEQGRLTGVVTQKQTAAVTLRLPLLEGAATVRISNVRDAQHPIELGRTSYPQVQQ